MSSRKLKATAHRKHRANTPYQKRKGVFQVVKDWLTPSKWTNPWEEEIIEEQDNQIPSHDNPMETPTTNLPHSKPVKPVRLDIDSMDEGSAPVNNNEEMTARNELIDGVTPIPSFTHKQVQTQAPPLFNGMPSTTSIQKHQQSRSYKPVPSGTTPSLAGGATNLRGGRMFTSTPCLSSDGQPVNRHVDTPRPPPLTNKTQSTHPQEPPSNRPSFSVSTFHSSISNCNMTGLSLSHSPFLSPFYSGRTVYGGMANRNSSMFRKRPRIEHTSPPTDNEPQIGQVIRPRPSNAVPDEPTTSQTARKILNTLHSISSPLHDARKLPLRVASPAKRMRLDKSALAAVKSPPPPVSSLTVPAPPTISAVKQPMVAPPTISGVKQPMVAPPTISGVKQPMMATSRTMKEPMVVDLTTSPDLSSKGGSVPLSPLKSPSSLSSSTTVGKMKTKRHSTHYSSKKDDDQGLPPPFPVPPLKLPSSLTNIPLPGVAASPNKVGVVSPPLILPSGSPSFASQPMSKVTTPLLPFTFTSPTEVTSKPSVQTTPTSGKGGMFAFRSPKVMDDLKDDIKESSADPPPLKMSGSVLDALKLPEYQLENIRKGGHSKPSKAAIDLTCDDDDSSVAMTTGKGVPFFTQTQSKSLGIEQKSNERISSKSRKESPPISGQVINSSDKRTPALTGNLTSGINLSATSGMGLGTSFGTSLKTSSGISLSSSSRTSLTTSLGTSSGIGLDPKPKQTSATIPLLPLVPSSSGTWSCDDCYASNPSDKMNCLCCNAPNKNNKGKTDSQPLKLPAPPLISSTSTDKWECPTCMINNDADEPKCVACGEKKPGSSSDSGSVPAPLTIGDGGLKLPTKTAGLLSAITAPSNNGGLKLGVGLKMGDGGPKIGAGLKIGGESTGLKIGGESAGLKIGGESAGLKIGGESTGLKMGGESTGLKMGGESIGLKIGGESTGLKIGGESIGLKMGDQNTGLKIGGVSGGISDVGGNSGLKLGSGKPMGGEQQQSSSKTSGVDLTGRTAIKAFSFGSSTVGSNATSIGAAGISMLGTTTFTTATQPPSTGSQNIAGTGFGFGAKASGEKGIFGNISSSTGPSNVFGQPPSSGISLGFGTAGETETPPTNSFAAGRLPTLSLLTSKQVPSSSSGSGNNIGMASSPLKLPALNPLTKNMPTLSSVGGISVSRPAITSQTFSTLSFTAPPIQKPTPTTSSVASTTSSFSFNTQSSLPPSSAPSLSANIFSIPSTAPPSSLPPTQQQQQQQSIFSNTSNIMFGQNKDSQQLNKPSQQMTTPFTGFGFNTSSTTKSQFPTTNVPANITGNTGHPPVGNTSVSSTGFNFNMFSSSAPSISFGANTMPSQGLVFGAGGSSGSSSMPSSNLPQPPPPSHPQPSGLFAFGGNNQQQQVQQQTAQSSFQFNPGRATSTGKTSAPGRTILKAKRRLK